MPTIVKMGHFLKTDDQGFLVNESSIDKIQSPWKEAVEEIKKVYLHVFSEHYPEKSGQMHEALGLAINPTDDKGKVVAVLDTFGSWMVEKVKEAFRT